MVMARPLRIERAGGWYHITNRGNDRRAVFLDDRDRTHFCELLEEMVFRFQVRLHAYVLMDNHYHLLLELTDANLSRAVQWLNVSYSVWFNHRHGRSGHLFQGRFKSIAVDPLSWGLELSRYVHLNPVRVARLKLGKRDRKGRRVGAGVPPDAKGVRERIERLRSYRWSSYRAYVGMVQRPGWLECGRILEWGGGKERERSRNYREYVESAVREGLTKSPWEELREQVVLGGEEFLQQLRGAIKGNPREQRGIKALTKPRPEIQEVIASLEKVRGEKWEEVRDRYGDEGRDLVLYVGRRACGLTLNELAAVAGMGGYKAVSAAIRRYEERLKRRKATREMLTQICRQSNIEM